MMIHDAAELSPEYLQEVRRVIWYIEHVLEPDQSPLTQCQLLDAIFSIWIHYAMEYNEEARTLAVLPSICDKLNESRKRKMQ